MRRAGVAIALLALLVPGAAFADGVYIPEVARKLPAIPLQRAILAHRDGKETLVVESSLEGPRGAYGWIIPVPATPTRLEKVSPGLIRTVALQTEPRVRHSEFPGGLAIVFAALAVVTPLALFVPQGALLILLLGVLSAIAIPNFMSFRMGASGDAPAPRVEELSRREVGSYETAVLRAAAAADLNAWLRENGFAEVPAAGVPAVEDYLAKGWRIVAAKLALREDGLASPHPLLIEFDAPAPVYPMRLTALAGMPLRLELFVVASGRATSAGYPLRVEFCDTFSRPGREPGESLRSASFGKAIAQADVGRVLWDGCVVTRLAGKVAPEAMGQDLFPGLETARPEQLTLRSRGAAQSEAAGRAAWIYGIGLLLIAFLPRSMRLRPYLALAALCPVVYLVSYVAAGEKIDVKVIGRSRSNWEGLRSALNAYIAEYDGTPEAEALAAGGADGRPRDAADRLFKSLYEQGNPYTGEPLRIEDSPGNVTVEVRHGLFAGFLLYERDGVARLVPAFGYLGKLSAPETIEELASQHQEVRLRAALELGRRREAAAVAPLENLVAAGNEVDRAAATVALAAISRDRSDGDRLVDILLQPPASPLDEEALRVLRSLADFPLVPAVIRRLKDPAERMRSAAAWRLGRWQDPAAVAPLIESLNDPAANVRNAAVGALGSFKAAVAGEALIATLQHDEILARRGAAEALGLMRDRRAVAPLAAAARQADEGLRTNAVQALGRIGGPEVHEAVVAAIRDRSEAVRVVAVSALGQTRDPRVIPPLRADFEGGSPQVRRAIIDALARIGTREAVDAIVQLPLDKQTEHAVDYVLRQLTGQKSPFGHDWKRWWETEGRTAALRQYR